MVIRVRIPSQFSDVPKRSRKALEGTHVQCSNNRDERLSGFEIRKPFHSEKYEYREETIDIHSSDVGKLVYELLTLELR